MGNSGSGFYALHVKNLEDCQKDDFVTVSETRKEIEMVLVVPRRISERYGDFGTYRQGRS